MREHMGLYHGKRKDNGEWVEGSLIVFPHSGRMMIFNHSDLTFYKVDPATVGECTGLPDKNGKLIFEGDICRACLNPEICTAVVEYRNDIASFVLTCDKDTMLLPIDMMVAKNSVGDAVWVEIIGNIHDNK